MFIYLKNYQGFNEALFELKDINFLVGDNSTGKSSIIALLSLLQTPKFWSAATFKFSDISKTTNFKDLLNLNSQEKAFSIGIFGNSYLSSYFDMLLIKFCEKDNIPVISEIKYNKEKTTIHAEYSDDKIYYSVIIEKKAFTKAPDYILNWIKTNTGKKEQILPIPKKINSINSILSDFNKYILKKSQEVLIYGIFPEFIYESPLREMPKEKYRNSEIESLNTILTVNEKKNELFEFGTNASMFDEIEIGEISRIDNEYEIEIHYKRIKLSINNVGFGISQIIPLLTNILTYKETYFSMQQPEVHLHPKGQVAFGDFIYKSATNAKNKFIIETHSDYLIDRFRYCIHNNKAKLNSQVLFFSKLDDGNNTINSIDILQNGEYKDCKELGMFREFFINEVAKIMVI